MTDFETFQIEKMSEKTKAITCGEVGEFRAEFETAGHPAQEFDFDAIDTRERWDAAAPILARVLTDHEKIIMQLRFHLDYSFEQIAGFMGTTRSAAQGACERALRKVRAEMTAKETLRK